MTMTYELGEIVAERQIDAIAEDGARTPVVLRIGKPLPDTLPGASGGDWYCPRHILGLGDETVEASFGVDSLQAFLLCVHSLQMKLAERADTARMLAVGPLGGSRTALRPHACSSETSPSDPKITIRHRIPIRQRTTT
jgi:hypothetical protein